MRRRRERGLAYTRGPDFLRSTRAQRAVLFLLLLTLTYNLLGLR